MTAHTTPTVLEGREAFDKLRQLYLDGFSTGAASILATFFQHVPEEARDEYIGEFMDKMLDDPALRAEVDNQIVETLRGIDTGPKNMSIDLKGNE